MRKVQLIEANSKNRMLTTSEVADKLSVHGNTVRRWSDRGLLRCYRIGHRGDRRFKREDVSDFLSNSGWNGKS